MATETHRDPSQFLGDRPRDLHGRQPPWHRLAHIVRELPRGIEALSADLRLGPGDTVVDYGCADRPYAGLFGTGVEYVGADLPGNPRADVVLAADGSLPLAGGSVDAVLSTQVLEHVTDPGLYLSECARVLRPGGRMLLSTHGFMVYHPDPDDYWRWTCAGLRRAVEQTGLEVVRFEGIMGLAASGFQLVQDAWYYRVPARLRPLFALVVQTLIRLADRVEPEDSRRMNALVFALVAEKPATA